MESRSYKTFYQEYYEPIEWFKNKYKNQLLKTL